MKCPKCSYIGFETGDRCKNCGYDFSLITDPSSPGDVDMDLSFRSSDDKVPAHVPWDDKFDGTIAAVDFGIMGRINRQARYWLAEILYGLTTGNYRRVAEIHFEAQYVPDYHNVEEFAERDASRSSRDENWNRDRFSDLVK